MKCIIKCLIIGLIIHSGKVLSQTVTSDYILGGIHDSVKKFTLPNPKVNLILDCGFGKSKFNVSLLDSIRNKGIDTIILVYTAYRQAESFSQSDLNVQRLNELKLNMPYIFQNNLITWKVVRQTGAKNDEDAKSYFHGFVIKFRKRFVEEMSTDKEIDFIAGYLSSLRCILPKDTLPAADIKDIVKPVHAEDFTAIDTLVKYPYSRKKVRYINIKLLRKDYRKIKRYAGSAKDIGTDVTKGYERILLDTAEVKLKYKPLFYLPKSKRKREKGILYTRRTILKRELAKDTLYIARTDFYTHIAAGIYPVYLIDGKLTTDPEAYKKFSFPDSVVTTTLKRNENYEQSVLVEDVTGSMYPYILQTFLWRRLYVAKAHLQNFVFFNDGDRTPDHKKIIGKTGGIYSTTTDSIEEVEKLVFKAMRNGSGSDCPENNIEALIYAQDHFPGKTIIMIADNYAPVKDIELVKKLTRPVDIILCGVYGSIMSDYITIANKTGGKIYTIEKTYDNLANLKEGETITIGGQKFVMKKGELKLTR